LKLILGLVTTARTDNCARRLLLGR